jgi:hypothetical protein
MNLFSALLLAAVLPQAVVKASGTLHVDTEVEVDAKGTYHTKVARKERSHPTAAVQVAVDAHGNLKELHDQDEQTDGSTQEKAFHEEKSSGDNDATLDELEAMMLADSVRKTKDEDDSLMERILPSWMRRRRKPLPPPPPPIDCVWADWENERPCTKTCGGGGILPRTRGREVKARDGGRDCQGPDWEIKDCGQEACPTTTTITPPPTTTPAWNGCTKQSASIVLFACLWVAASFM